MVDLIREGNRLIDEDGDAGPIAGAVEEIVGVLGLDDPDPAPSWESSLTDEEIHALVVERNEARSRREFEVADEIRDRLVSAGVSIEDGPNGTRWIRR